MAKPSHFDAVHVTPALHERRERVFLVFTGIFLGAMTMLNILGITKFIHLGPLALAVGVLPYPLTFLCTDFISEFYGRRRANFVVWVGLMLNALVFLFMYLGDAIPPVSPQFQPPWQILALDGSVMLNTGETVSGNVEMFHILYTCMRGAVLASMCAYIAAQFCDVFLFHFWKKLTKGKHLWLRNNGSTMISQLVDSVAVILITFWHSLANGDMTVRTVLALIGSSYMFKLVIAAADTIPFYLGVHYLGNYLQIDPTREHDADKEGVPSQ
ncbi:MAG: queuosine precursor transporter [Phycisphaerales bacterium]|nr:queuosine precursor transporter [Phycisphaerales bacterium]